MIWEFSLIYGCIIVAMAFVCEYVDSTLGMGFGTILTPVLIIMGYTPLQIVPCVLVSELISGLSAAFLHHREGNVNFALDTLNRSVIMERLRSLGYIGSFKKGASKHLKVAVILGVCSVIGTVLAVFVAINMPKLWLKLYIGILVLGMGVVIIICRNKDFSFSWKKITFLGIVASFNKGISGGGYGPVVTSGQVLSGVEGKSAVGITSLAEGITCAVGLLMYVLLAKSSLDLRPAPFIVLGAILSVPLSAKNVKKITEKKLKTGIAVLTISLGLFTIIKTIWG